MSIVRLYWGLGAVPKPLNLVLYDASENFNVRHGVRQGSVLSPLLFQVCMMICLNFASCRLPPPPNQVANDAKQTILQEFR